MPVFRWILALVLLIPAGTVDLTVQSAGSLEVKGRVKIGTKLEKITRKRFYLFRGGLDSNKALVEKMKAPTAISCDCFYCQLKASPALIEWLKAGDCESPYCRDISKEDAEKVPEFQAAYQKSLTQYKNKPDVAQKWLTTNLAPDLRDGYYRQRKTATDTILAGVKPIQSSMTDTVSVVAIFIDIPVKAEAGKTETFLVSNVVPIEIGGKGYTWACEVEIGVSKKVNLPLQVPEAGKTIKKCEVIVKALPVCTAGVCNAK